MIRRFWKWLRGLSGGRAAQPEALIPAPPAHPVMHYASGMRPACDLPPGPWALITIEWRHVTCANCKVIAARAQLRLVVSVR